MITNPEIIQAVLARANREPKEEVARAIVAPLFKWGLVQQIEGKWVFQEYYANISLITAGTVVTKYYHYNKLENIEPDVEETEGYLTNERTNEN